MKRKMTITFGGNDYSVVPSFAVIEQIEQRFDLITYLRSVQGMKTRIKDVAWVLFCALAESGEDVTYNDVGEMVLSDIQGATLAASQVVTEAIGTGPAKQSKKKAQETETSGPE